MTLARVADSRRPPSSRSERIQKYARIAAILGLISLIAGGFGEAFVPSQLISSDANVTASNILASESLYRLSFVGYLIEATCDIALALLFYALLSPVDRDLAALAVVFRLIGTTLFAFAQLFYFAPLLILGGGEYLKTFNPDQLNSLALLSLRIYVYGGGIFVALYGIPYIVFGYLMFRSGYLPRLLGALVALAGAGFVLRNFVLVLAPAVSTTVFYVPVVLAGVAIPAWLLVKGIDMPKWEERAALV